ncbi:hypothetical protein AMECASPLE_022313 [Ameca splendens]|uniref:Uncharacterized protein n=1 Tax=Ameca splendens TaxID=208324 RepID=A0ABV0YS03_9TELE
MSHIPAASSASLHHFPPLAEGYTVLPFEVYICIIRLGYVIVYVNPPLPSEGAPEERGCCPAQQWRTPLLSAAIQPCTCIFCFHVVGRLQWQFRLGPLQPLRGKGAQEKEEEKAEGGSGAVMGEEGQGLS